MINKNATFYFANLGADVLRCALAAESEKTKEYESSLERARVTLRHIEKENRPEAHEEGLLLLRALEYARESDTLPTFREHLDALIGPYATRLAIV